MTKIKFATFNCENLFRRFKFNSKLKKSEIDDVVENGFIIEKSKFEIIDEPERKFTAMAINETDADIICMQEVENMDALKNFNSVHLKKAGYIYKMVIDGNDPRLIDVAVLSRYPFENVVTHQFQKDGNSFVFSRDNLEVNFNIKGTPLTIFVNHFKSMMGGRPKTKPRRVLQAKSVLDILKNRFDNPDNHNWIIAGDLNDYPQDSSSLDKLLKSNLMENVVERLAPEEQWTHFWDGAPAYPKDSAFRQIDYIFLSKKLANKNKTAMPVVIRGGLSKKADKRMKKENASYPLWSRYTGIGDNRPHASDHCPIVIEIEL